MAVSPSWGERGEGAALSAARAERRTETLVLSEQADWQRLAEAVRRQVAACLELDAPGETLTELADRAEKMAARLEDHAAGKRFGLVESMWEGQGDSLNYLPFSPIMGRLNPASYRVSVVAEGDRAVGSVVLGEAEEGAAGLAHGGVISGIWDEVLAAANALRRTGGPTGRLTIKYRKPTPLYEPLRYVAWVEQVDERKVLVRGECTIAGAPDAVLTEAEGIFIKLREPGIDWHDRDRSGEATEAE